MFTKGVVANLIRPIHCHTGGGGDQDSFSAQACQQVQQNLFGEQESFLDGMAVGDLMDAHAARKHYADFENWTSNYSYCTHSDWVTGFYTNFYSLSYHSCKFSNKSWLAAMYRIGWEIGSTYKGSEGACTKDGFDFCKPEEDGICHRLNVTEKEMAFERARRKR